MLFSRTGAAVAAAFVSGLGIGYNVAKKPEISVPVPPAPPAPYRLFVDALIGDLHHYRVLETNGKLISPATPGEQAITDHIKLVRDAGYIMTDAKGLVRVSRAGDTIVAEFKAIADGSNQPATVICGLPVDYASKLARGFSFMSHFVWDMTGVGLKVDPMVAFALRDIYRVIARQPVGEA